MSIMRSSRVNCSLTTEFALVQENILLQNERITQLYVIQSEQNPFVWFGVLFIDQGIFKGTFVRFNIFIEESYPDCSCPKVVLDPIPCHPLVNPFTGELDTKNAFPDWDSNQRRLFELFLFIKRVMSQADEYITQIGNLLKDDRQRISAKQLSSQKTSEEFSPKAASIRSQQYLTSISTSSGMNTESSLCLDSKLANLFTWFHHTLDFYKIYDNHPDEFSKRLEEFKEKCLQQTLDRPALCGDDQNAIVFSPWNLDIHEPLRNCVLAGRFTPASLFATYHKDTDSVSFIPGHESTNNSQR